MPKSRKRKYHKRKKAQRSNSSPQSNADYVDAKVDLYQEVSEPSYNNVMDWMRGCDGRHVAFDFWARGNYTRRLIYQRSQKIEPLLVQVSYVDEMRWAYRRLALLGLPVEFVYCGDVSKSSKVFHMSNVSGEFLWDAGWGYYATMEKNKGQYIAGLLGYANLMPETLVDWLIDEVSEDFIDGKVFVSPAELIGINPRFSDEGLSKLAGITRGAPMSSNYEVTKAALELNMPYLDNMSPHAFRKFLNDHEGELVRFQRAFRNLVAAREKSEQQLKDYIEELKHEIAELTVSGKHENTRKNILKLGGMLGTFTASFAMAIQTQASSLLSIVGAAGMGAAAAGLLDLWKQATEREQNMAANPYFILWKLGMSRPSEVKRTSKVKIAKPPKLSPEQFALNAAHHWLCPPTTGVKFLVVADEK